MYDGRSKRTLALTVVVIVVAALPTLVFRFLPMTDLPQHVAIASILEHHSDPTYGFAQYYNVEWFHTPYVLPYALAVFVAKVLALSTAMRIVVFLSTIAYPLGLLAIMRASDKPAWFALFAVPLMFHRAFFWGFIAFDLSIGLSLAAYACVIGARRSLPRDVGFCVLTLASTFTHVYGLALLIGLVGLHAIFGGFRELKARPWPFVSVLVGVALWLWKSGESVGYGEVLSPPFVQRLVDLPRQILGGYADRSEGIILVVALGAWLLFVRPRERRPVELVAYAMAAGNLLLYFVLPQATLTAKFIHFRHAFLACALLPVCVSEAVLASRAFLRKAALGIAVGAATLNTWAHLMFFDTEARAFTPIVDALPPQPKIVSLMFDKNGLWMSTNPYMHFVAYAQAEKGGMITMTFPAVFWNLPVVMRKDAPVPKTATNFEWNLRFDDRAFGYFYDYAVVRILGPATPSTTAAFPFEQIVRSPPWYLYKRLTRPSPSSSPTPPAADQSAPAASGP